MLKENQKIWRYLNLWKFESMLKEGALFFAKASVMDDKGEGRVSGMARAMDNLVATSLPNAERNKL